jgi:4-alpha-glucanotransferase
MQFPRKSGILVHPTSLPGAYGMGEIGVQAIRLIDTLAEMKQSLWQVLPLGPTGYGDSPYQSLSTFAGNDKLVCFETLVNQKLLLKGELKGFPQFPADTVDYGPVLTERRRVLDIVTENFAKRAGVAMKKRYEAFIREQAFWLDDMSLFSAIKEANGLRPWTEWPRDVSLREPKALERARRELAEAVEAAKVRQFLFFDQWSALRRHAAEKGVQIVGDIPIFVAHDSADVWANRHLYYLDERGNPTVIAGVPPDYFSATGQRWGNPLYRWDVHRQEGYAWWQARIKSVLALVDIVRIDHFRGFEAYWEIPASEPTAVKGLWVKGPGADLFRVLKEKMGDLPIIAEDLGVITPEVEALRDDFDLPGMRILQFAFGNDDQAEAYRPHSYPPNCVVYTGTHDNDTTVGWFNSQAGEGSTRTQEDIDKERRTILDYVGTDGSQIQWDLMALALKSKANTAVFPMQDLLGLGSEARMNVPGREGGNWRWRYRWELLTPELQRRLAETTVWAKRG